MYLASMALATNTTGSWICTMEFMLFMLVLEVLTLDLIPFLKDQCKIKSMVLGSILSTLLGGILNIRFSNDQRIDDF